MSKYSIMVKDTEKEIYRIFKELEKHGRSSFCYPKHTRQSSVARTIGVRVSPLVKKGMMLPPAKNRIKNIDIVALPINIEIKEKKLKKGSKFYFNRRNNIF